MDERTLSLFEETGAEAGNGAPRRRGLRKRVPPEGNGGDRPVALVTGASRGIGRGIALALAAERWRVVVHYVHDSAAAEETLAAVRAAGGDGVVVRGDLADAGDRARIVAESLAVGGTIDLLVDNAGIAPPVRSDLLELAEADWDTVLDVNLKGTFFLSQRVAREMVARKRPGETPRIVVVTSISAEVASTNRGAYCVSKAGLSMVVRLLAARLAEHGIAVHEVRPGVVATDMTAGVREKYDALVARGAWPIARWGTPEDVGKAVAALARGDFPFSTGDVFHVDGGFGVRTL
ncbi:MAG: 3-ketoacyl-ACP reductase [Armatimonadota bacterium]